MCKRKKYILHTERGTLHINGLCYHSKRNSEKYLEFDTEKEACQYLGKTPKLCKLCAKKRNKIATEERNNGEK